MLQRLTDLDQVRKEIMAETDREAGGNKAVSREPIHLSLYSPQGATRESFLL
jgi:replication fork clamp-binding protein CrfC